VKPYTIAALVGLLLLCTMESHQLDGETARGLADKGFTPDVPGSGKTFSGYQWTYFSSLQQGPLRSRAESFLASVDWVALREYAAAERKGIDCSLLPDIGLGYNHMVRIVEFTDGVRWVARLRLPSLAGCYSAEAALKTKSDCEFHTISLLRQRTNLPIPEVYAYEGRSDCSVKAPFMLMDCLEGNVGMDLGMEIPPEHKQAFLNGLAKIHVSNIIYIIIRIYMGRRLILLIAGPAVYRPATPDWYDSLLER
jgi:hypothetical protein